MSALRYTPEYVRTSGGGTFAVAGTLKLSGTLTASYGVHPAGTMLLSGSVRVTFAGTVTTAPTGTLRISGTLTTRLTITSTCTGTIRLSGANTATLGFASSPTGQLTLSGTATSSWTVATFPVGQLTLSGTLAANAIGRQEIRVRERPPLELHVAVSTPAGDHQRWGNDDPNPENDPAALTFSTTMPGGFENCSQQLQRDPAREYPDLEELSTITVLGAGGQVAWQGRVEQLPDTGGDQAQISPAAVGWQSHLDDDSSARDIFVDRDITKWQGPSVQRQKQWLSSLPPVVAGAPSVGPDFTTHFPSLVDELQGAWSQNQVVEAWYDGRGIPIAGVYAAWETDGGFTLAGGNAFGAQMFLCVDDTGTVYDKYPAGSASLPDSGTYLLQTANLNRAWALLQLWNDTVPGGQDGVNYDLFWTALGVYGAHGLPLHGTADSQNAQGVLASDVIPYALSKWAPKLAYTKGAGGTIQPSSFVIPQLVYLDATTVSQMVKDASKYELLDWAVWEEPIGVWPAQPCFYLNARGARGNVWRTRVGPAQLQETGQQVSSLYNGVIVQWTDVTGVTRTVGPPGSRCNYIDSSLVTSDPENPANQAGINRWGLVTMGTSTLAGATQIGGIFLREQALLNHSGQATLNGYVQDASTGVWWPAWMVRAGDSVIFSDARDPSPRRVVSTSWDDTQKANTLQLDQPPQSLQALLERLSVVLAPYGMS